MKRILNCTYSFLIRLNSIVPVWLVGVFFGVRLAMMFPTYPYHIDDAYITYRYAYNIANGNGFVYNIGERVLGTSTPLYALILGMLGRMGADIPVASRILGLMDNAFTLLLFCLMLSSVRKDGNPLDPVIKWGFLLMVALDPNLAFTFVYGMETHLYILLIVLAWFLLFIKREWLCGIVFGLLILVRLDGLFWIAPTILLLWIRDGVNGLKPTLKLTLPIVVVLVPWVAFSVSYFGSIFPQSGLTKLGSGSVYQALYFATGYSIQNVVNALFRTNGAFWFKILEQLFISYLPVTAFVIFSTIILIRIRTRQQEVRDGFWQVAVILTCIATYIAAFVAFNMPGFHWYYYPVCVMLLLIAGLIYSHGSQFLMKKRWWRTILVLLVCWQILNFTSMVARAYFYADIPQFDQTHRMAADWIRTNTPIDARVAVGNIGIIGYYSDRRILDLRLLVSRREDLQTPPDYIATDEDYRFLWPKQQWELVYVTPSGRTPVYKLVK